MVRYNYLFATMYQSVKSDMYTVDYIKPIIGKVQLINLQLYYQSVTSDVYTVDYIDAKIGKMQLIYLQLYYQSVKFDVPTLNK